MDTQGHLVGVLSMGRGVTVSSVFLCLDLLPRTLRFLSFLSGDLLPRTLPFSYLNQTGQNQPEPAR